MSIYLVIVAATLVLGVLMPQSGKNRKYYIILMTAIHLFVSAFRYNHLTGDLMKYHYEFNTMASYGWFSEEVLHEGRNSGFYLLMKLINTLTNGNFQALLIVISILISVVLGYVVWKYSPAPWMSFLIWNCMGFYIFGLTSIKQALAMAFVMLAFIGITEKKPVLFLAMIALAGFIHVPALVFLPAYWFTQRHVTRNTVFFYLLLGAVLYVFKNQFVEFIRSFYYEDDEIFIFSGELGSRFIMLLGFTLFSLLLTGLQNRDYEKLFHLMAIATILQMLSGFDNIFTRLTDYYFQFSILYLPMVFYPCDSKPQRSLVRPILPFNERSMRVFGILIAAFIIWFYYTYNININIASTVDNYLNFRFMWDVT